MSLSTTPGTSLPTFNLAHAHTPRAVLAPRSTEEVADAVRAAAAAGERLTPVGTGHGWTHRIEGGFALLTGALDDVTVDPTTETVRIGAGATWAQVLSAAAPYGLAPVAGSAPGVGVVGYLLGGGLSPWGRTFGWGSDYLRSAQVVSGTGEVLTVSPTSHPDLFWALRGGKEIPAVVTSVEVGLVRLTRMYGGGLFFDAADADAVLAGWVAWSAGLPEEVNTSIALLRLPDLATVPEPLRGRCVLHVRIAVPLTAADSAATAAAAVAPVRALAPTVLDTLGELPATALGALHADPETPMPVVEAGALLGALDRDAVSALLEVVGPGAPAPLSVVEVRRLGGRLAHPPALADAVIGREAAYGLFVVSAPLPELFDGPVAATVAALAQAMAPWTTGTFQPNFVGSLNLPGAVDRSRNAEDRARLQRLRETYDPAGLIGH
ncbi:FAD-binding protein [Nocardioides sp.]|uniref:FAD-binding oxidoreductase n=1 Tax=Nocardioides sp. TaxID=35761 RepID=UPI00262C5C2C|nr:FAD-binding protein [Nocardioides sp.]